MNVPAVLIGETKHPDLAQVVLTLVLKTHILEKLRRYPILPKKLLM